MRKIAVLLWTALTCSSAFAQVSTVDNSTAYSRYRDSLKTHEHPYSMPLLGKKAYARGIDLQKAFGLSFVYFTQTQEIAIDRISVGFNGGNQVDLSDYIQFGPTIAVTNAYTVRPDVWVLPFLNVYGILGVGTTQTEVTLLEPVGFQTAQHFTAQSYGIGATLTGALGPIWVAWDNNYNFVDVDAIVEPIPAFNSSVRIGHNFVSSSNPERAFAVWGGVFYQSLQNDTKGSLPMSDIFPQLGSGAKIADLRDWAADLPLAQRIVANQIIDKLEEMGQDAAANGTIDYELDKRVAAPFNLILGFQYQYNKNWILRSEVGVFGKRSQFMLNLNYRFDLI